MVGTPSAGSPSTVAAAIARATTASATGRPGNSRWPSNSRTIATTPTASRRYVHLADLHGQQCDALEEVVPAARNAEQARQLRHRDGQARADLNQPIWLCFSFFFFFFFFLLAQLRIANFQQKKGAIYMSSKKTTVTFALGVIALSTQAHADLLGDSKATLGMRNFYFNNDNRDGTAAPSKTEEWAQGFMLDYKSGYTDGTIGFGVDALGLMGITLDSGKGRHVGSSMIPSDSDNRAVDEWSRLGLTGKVKVSKSELRLGTLDPEDFRSWSPTTAACCHRPSKVARLPRASSRT